MSFRTDWNVDKYNYEFESYKRWKFRKDIMIAIKHNFPEERVVCLARILANIRFLGCKYSDSVTEVLKEICDKTGIEIGPLETKNWCEKPKKEPDVIEISDESDESLNCGVRECTTNNKHMMATRSRNNLLRLRSPSCETSNETELRTTHPFHKTLKLLNKNTSKAQRRKVFKQRKAMKQEKKAQKLRQAHQLSLIQILEEKGIITHEASQLAKGIIFQESSIEQVECNQSDSLNQGAASALTQTVATPEHSELSVVETEPSKVPDSSNLIPSTSASLCSLMKEDSIFVDKDEQEGGVKRANSLPLVSQDCDIPRNIFGSLRRTTEKLERVLSYRINMFPLSDKAYNPLTETNVRKHIKSTIEYMNNEKSNFVDCEDEVKEILLFHEDEVKEILLFHEDEFVPEPEKTTSKDEKKLNAVAETLHKHTIAFCKVMSDDEKLKYETPPSCIIAMARVVKPCNQLVILWEDGEHPLRTLYRVTMVWRKQKLNVQFSEENNSVWKTTVSFDGDTIRAAATSECKSASLFAASYYMLWCLQQSYYTIIIKDALKNKMSAEEELIEEGSNPSCNVAKEDNALKIKDALKNKMTAEEGMLVEEGSNPSCNVAKEDNTLKLTESKESQEREISDTNSLENIIVDSNPNEEESDQSGESFDINFDEEEIKELEMLMMKDPKAVDNISSAANPEEEVKVVNALENENVPAKPDEEGICPGPNEKRKKDPVRVHFILSSEKTDEKQEKEVTEERKKAKGKCKGMPLNTERNVGAKMLRLMGWSGSGLGKYSQGMKEPIGISDYKPFKRLGFGILEERFAQKRNKIKKYRESCKERRELQKKERLLIQERYRERSKERRELIKKERIIQEMEKKIGMGKRSRKEKRKLQNALQIIKQNTLKPKTENELKYEKKLQQLEAMNIRNDDQMVINKKLIHEYAMTATPTSDDLLLPSKVAPIEKTELMLFAMQLGLNCRVIFVKKRSAKCYNRSLCTSFVVTKKQLRETCALVQPWFLLDALLNGFKDFHCNVVLPGVPLLTFEDATFVVT